MLGQHVASLRQTSHPIAQKCPSARGHRSFLSILPVALAARLFVFSNWVFLAGPTVEQGSFRLRNILKMQIAVWSKNVLLVCVPSVEDGNRNVYMDHTETEYIYCLASQFIQELGALFRIYLHINRHPCRRLAPRKISKYIIWAPRIKVDLAPPRGYNEDAPRHLLPQSGQALRVS